LEEHVDQDLYSKLREIVLTYDERLKEAESNISAHAYMTKGACQISTCPDCLNDTVTDDPEKGIFCFFCYRPAGMVECVSCGQMVPIDDLDEMDNCLSCLDYRMSRF
jgi:hypothetical protein